MLRLRQLSLHSHTLAASFPLIYRSLTTATISDSSFLAGDGVSWTTLGVSETLANSLSRAGLHRPSLTQAACVPSIVAGSDTVVAAETGGGKTHGYLVPIIDRLYGEKRNVVCGGEGGGFDKICVVVCPCVVLCDQVVRMANGLLDDKGDPLVFSDVLRGNRGWPVKKLDVVVVTPYKLLSYLYAVHRERNRPFWFLRSVKYVVFDEADLLLSGRFFTQVICLINMLQFDEKQSSQTQTLVEKGRNKANSNPMCIDSGDGNGKLKRSFFDEEKDFCDVIEVKHLLIEPESGSDNRKAQKQSKTSYVRSKQYIFVGATLPLNRKNAVCGILELFFGDAKWVSGSYLHRHNPRLQQRWVQITVDTQINALMDALNQQRELCNIISGQGKSQTLVFANTVEAVESVTQKLLRARIECSCYHTKCTLEESIKRLAEFHERGGVLVCTDDVVRGLDIPNVSHVIQAELTTSAVDYLHRLGRTARAGQPGLVTSLYTESNHRLVAAVCEAEKAGDPVDFGKSIDASGSALRYNLVEPVVDAGNQCFKSAKSSSRSMMLANDVEAVESVACILPTAWMVCFQLFVAIGAALKGETQIARVSSAMRP
ncbi:DEAD-box ATP-dependent RNA helicase 22-like protein [Drosera capensis]